MKTTPALPTWRKALVGLFVSFAISAGALGGTASAQARPQQGERPGEELCASMVRGVKPGAWTGTNDPTYAISETFRRKLSGTNTGLDINDKSLWYAVVVRSEGTYLTVRCMVFLEGKWSILGLTRLNGKVVSSGPKMPASVEIQLPLTPEQCARLVAAQAAESWKQENGIATSAPSKQPKGFLESLIGTGTNLVNRLTDRFISVQVFTNKPAGDGKLPATCYVYDAKTATYIPLGKTLVTNVGGGGRLTFR